MINETNTVEKPTMLEFLRYNRKFCSPKTLLKFFRVGVKINFGGQWIISTWVLNEDMNIQTKGKIMGITMIKTRIKKAVLTKMVFSSLP
jgi:hypothetical protein